MVPLDQHVEAQPTAGTSVLAIMDIGMSDEIVENSADVVLVSPESAHLRPPGRSGPTV